MVNLKFIIAGAPRCGTTFLANLLMKDSRFDILLEPHFFDKISRPLNSYISKFNPTKEILGDKTAGYFFSESTPQNIKVFNPNIKIIIVLRDPIERTFSHYSLWRNNGKISPKLKFQDFMRKHKKIIDISDYKKHLDNFYDYFPREQILLLDFEELVTEPSNLIKKIEFFLGVREIDYDLDKLEYNSSNNIKLKLLKSSYIRKLKNYIPKTFKTLLLRHFNRNSKKKIPNEIKLLLENYYSKEVLNWKQLLL